MPSTFVAEFAPFTFVVELAPVDVSCANSGCVNMPLSLGELFPMTTVTIIVAGLTRAPLLVVEMVGTGMPDIVTIEDTITVVEIKMDGVGNADIPETVDGVGVVPVVTVGLGTVDIPLIVAGETVDPVEMTGTGTAAAAIIIAGLDVDAAEKVTDPTVVVEMTAVANVSASQVTAGVGTVVVTFIVDGETVVPEFVTIPGVGTIATPTICDGVTVAPSENVTDSTVAAHAITAGSDVA